MPRFTGQNKKNINPRWFMDEKQEIVKEEIDFDKLDLDDEKENIRGLSKDLTGKKDSYMIPDNFESMSREELIDLVRDMMASPEGQDFERKMRDEEEAEMGTDNKFDKMPKQSGMGRPLEENITYKVIEDEDDGGPTVIIKGIGTTFQQMLDQMNGKTITFADGDVEQFNFSDMNGAKDAEEAALHMIKLGIAKHYVEAWAIMNDMQATQKGARD